MFIKITKRRQTRRKTTEFQFSICQSYRQDGKVKHRSLLWLAAIPEMFLDAPAWLDLFWKTVEYKLAQATNIPAFEKERFLKRIAEIVPLP